MATLGSVRARTLNLRFVPIAWTVRLRTVSCRGRQPEVAKREEPAMAASTINRPDRALTVETILKTSRPEPAEPARATPSGWMAALRVGVGSRSEEHTSELQSLMRISYAGFCLKKQKHK